MLTVSIIKSLAKKML